MRVSFYELFTVTEQGLKPKEPVEIGGITLTPGVTEAMGYRVGGVNLERYVGRDVEVKKDQVMDMTVIKGFY